MLNSYRIMQNTVIDNKKSKEEMDMIKRDVETKEQFNILYKDRTSVQKQTNGFSEYADIADYPYMIKGILLKDGEYIDLEDAKFSCRDGLIYISKFGHYSVNLTEVKRVFYKYSYINELKEIHTLLENSRIRKQYMIYQTNRYENNDSIEINIEEYDRIIYFKGIEEKYAIIEENLCLNMENISIFIPIKLGEFAIRDSSISIRIVFNKPIKNPYMRKDNINPFMYIDIDKNEIMKIRKDIEEMYEKRMSLTGYNPDIKVFVRGLGEYYGKMYQEYNGFYSIRIGGKIVEDILVKNGVGQEIHEAL